MALYLNPLDALHGDLGVVASDDVCLLLSNSGETSELIDLLPHLKRRGTARIALVGQADSSLAKGSDVTLEAFVDREICPLNLAPTASTAVAMAIGDALAAVWMERRGISPADFALNHPAGSLGKQLTMTVADLMVPAKELPPLQAKTTLPEVIGKLTQGAIGSGWVENPNTPRHLLGLITDGDLRRGLRSHDAKQWALLTAEDLMTTDPITVRAEMLAVEAIQKMEHNRRKPISVMPVVNANGEFEGLLRLHDLVQAGACMRQLLREWQWQRQRQALQKLELLVLDVDGVLTDGGLWFDAQGQLQKRFDVRDGLGIRLLQGVGVQLAFLSGGQGGATEVRAKQLGIQECLVGIKDKPVALEALQQRLGVTANTTAFLGDDLNDLAVRPGVRLLLAPADACRPLRRQADGVLRHRGGHGAVRELAERILQARGDWEVLRSNGWRERND